MILFGYNFSLLLLLSDQQVRRRLLMLTQGISEAFNAHTRC
jgi:hypothetical protein